MTVQGQLPYEKPRFDFALEDVKKVLDWMEAHLALRSFIYGHSISVADVDAFGTLWPIRRWTQIEFGANVERWWNFIEKKSLGVYGKCWRLKGEASWLGKVVMEEKKPA